MEKKPVVKLIDYTGAASVDPARYAANVLAFTKQTRLSMNPDLWDEVCHWTEETLMRELEYMANTIPSSWEFVEYKFLINNVTRAFTHQFVRTRTGSYAQQTMRVLDVGGWTYDTGPTIADNEGVNESYKSCMQKIDATYRHAISNGAAIEDARGVLPTNIHTNIVAKFDLRTLADTARKRASGRTQGEYRTVRDLMLSEVLRVHPWASLFLERTFDKSAAELEERIMSMSELPDLQKTEMVKLIDQMRATA